MAVANMPMRLLLQVADNDPVSVAEFDTQVRLTRAERDEASVTYRIDSVAFADDLRRAIAAAAAELQERAIP
ncbi:hypothetical protein [Agrococcus casei]|uniref:hypothetical protein n=1 Tax=Agrococcus casei TaxID=343512 RepID=UPI003F92E0EE